MASDSKSEIIIMATMILTLNHAEIPALLRGHEVIKIAARAVVIFLHKSSLRLIAAHGARYTPTDPAGVFTPVGSAEEGLGGGRANTLPGHFRTTRLTATSLKLPAVRLFFHAIILSVFTPAVKLKLQVYIQGNPAEAALQRAQSNHYSPGISEIHHHYCTRHASGESPDAYMPGSNNSYDFINSFFV